MTIKKILFCVCMLFLFSTITVYARPVLDDGSDDIDTTPYCCDGHLWDGHSSCTHKGVKVGSCSRTVDITSSSNPQKLSFGESVSISGCDNGCTISSSFGDVVSASNTSVSVVKNPVNCTKKGSVTYSRAATISSNGVKTTYNSLTLSFTAIAAWGGSAESNKTIWSTNRPTPTSKVDANEQSKNIAYEGCTQDPNNGHKWTCSRVWKRGCNVPKEEMPGCYKQNSTGFYYWGLYGGKSDYTFISSITDYKYCVSKFECSTKYPNKADNKTPCNSEGTIGGTYEKKCDTIYKITCDETIKTKFTGPVLDSTLESLNNAYLYPGTGFKYRFGATTTVSCKGTFDNNRYTLVENYIKNYANKVNGTSSGSLDDMFYTSALDGLKQIKKSYTDWKLNYKFDGKIEIRDEVNNKVLTTVSLVPTSGGDTKIVEKCGSLPNGTIKDFTYLEKHSFEKQLPMAYLTRDGKVVYQVGEGAPCTNCEPLDYKFFISDNKDYVNSNNYHYIVTATSLGYGKYATDQTKCQIGVLGNEIIYRHIDASDPFLLKTKPDRPIGANWSNSKYDFTKIIHTNVWSKSSMYNKITLTKEDNLKIQGETRGNASYYVGACTKGTASSLDTICAKLRGSKK